MEKAASMETKPERKKNRKKMFFVCGMLLWILAGCSIQTGSGNQENLSEEDKSRETKDLLTEEDRQREEEFSEKEGFSELVYSHSMDLQYAKEFSVDYYEGGYGEIKIGEVGRYLLIPEGKPVPKKIEEDMVVIQQPIQNIYLAASGVMDMFLSIEGLKAIGFSSLKEESWHLEEARKAMEEEGDILYAGKYSAPDYELLLLKECGLAIENTMIDHTPQVKEQLERLGIPVLVDYSSKEPDPLGRSEWVRLYGLLTGQKEAADQAFLEQAALFEEIRKEAEGNLKERKKETVAFFYITLDGKVNMRKPSDYLARMMEMAGGEYIYPDRGQEDRENQAETLQLEEFYALARDADILIYNSTVDGELHSIDELTAKSELMKRFQAVKEGNVFCTTDKLYQSSMKLGTILFDLHEIFQGREEQLTYFYRLTK